MDRAQSFNQAGLKAWHAAVIFTRHSCTGRYCCGAY